MRLRNQLLLLALVALVLPWAGWQFVRGMEAGLREGQARALVDSAGIVAGALAATRPVLPPVEPVFYVHEATQPLLLDGEAGDWHAAWQQAQAPGGEGSPLRVALARYGGAVHLLAEVRDDTPLGRGATIAGSTKPAHAADSQAADSQAANSQAANSQGDVLRLLVDDGNRVHALRVFSAASASAGIANEAGDAAALRPFGAWRETDAGYRIELRFPGTLLPQRLGLEVVDAAADRAPLRHGSNPDRLGGLWPLARRSPELSRQLAQILPPGLRARVLHPDGWVLAEAGTLAPLEGSALPGWQRVLYGWLAEPAPASAAADGAGPMPLRNVLEQGAASSWSRIDGGVQLQLDAVAPLRVEQQPRALLQLQRRSDAALLAQQALSGLIGATLLAMLAVGAMLFAYASWLGYRIRRLGRAVDQAMAREGAAPAPFAASSAGDEIGELSRRFARLLEEVAGYTDYLRTLASRLSHELHTPLAVVRSSLENLEAQPLDAGARAYLLRAREGSTRLSGIIRAMSEATRVERAIASADAERFDLRELLQGCAEGYRPLLAPRRLELLLPPQPVAFHGAPELLAQALDKLVENARSFCPEDGWIALALATRGDVRAGVDPMVELVVANAGPALPAAAQGRLFDSLVSVRGHGTRTDGTPHLGLGLHIVRLIVELHRGEALARDLPGGDGVEFRLRLRGMPPPDSPR